MLGAIPAWALFLSVAGALLWVLLVVLKLVVLAVVPAPFYLWAGTLNDEEDCIEVRITELAGSTVFNGSAPITPRLDISGISIDGPLLERGTYNFSVRIDTHMNYTVASFGARSNVLGVILAEDEVFIQGFSDAGFLPRDKGERCSLEDAGQRQGDGARFSI